MREKQAFFWKAVVMALGLISLSSGLLKVSEFWSSYVLDIAGPAWGYVLVRVQYKLTTDRFLNIRFSPESAFLTIISICFIIEAMQYFNLYDSTFDPFDLLAYFSGTFIVYIMDKSLSKQTEK